MTKLNFLIRYVKLLRARKVSVDQVRQYMSSECGFHEAMSEKIDLGKDAQYKYYIIDVKSLKLGTEPLTSTHVDLP